MKQDKKKFNKPKRNDRNDRNDSRESPSQERKHAKASINRIKKEVLIEKLASTGEGIAKDNGIVYFVTGGVPGDRVELTVPDTLPKNYYHADIAKLITPSTLRAKPECAIFDECGACQWQHIDYNVQLKAKTDVVAEQFKHIGKLDITSKLEPCQSSDDKYGYRSKAQFVASRSRSGQMVLGYYAEGSHKLTAVPTCPVLHPKINKILPDIISILNSLHITAYDEENHTGSMRHVVIIYSTHEDKYLVGLVVNEHSRLPQKQLTQAMLKAIPNLGGLIININSRETNVIYGDKSFTLHGKDFLVEKLGDKIYKRGLTTFFQANNGIASKIFTKIKENTKENEAILDLYCGVGTIGLFVAGKSNLIVGLEENPASVQLADQNAHLNKFFDEKAYFGVFNIERGLPEELAETQFNTVIVDPPRKGLSPVSVQKIISIRPDKIAYVTCNPTTAARDCRMFVDNGYEIMSVTPFDMFPQTYHVEGLVLLKKK